jgi:hypothetical protein
MYKNLLGFKLQNLKDLIRVRVWFFPTTLLAPKQAVRTAVLSFTLYEGDDQPHLQTMKTKRHNLIYNQS